MRAKSEKQSSGLKSAHFFFLHPPPPPLPTTSFTSRLLSLSSPALCSQSLPLHHSVTLLDAGRSRSPLRKINPIVCALASQFPKVVQTLQSSLRATATTSALRPCTSSCARVALPLFGGRSRHRSRGSVCVCESEIYFHVCGPAWGVCGNKTCCGASREAKLNSYS